MDHGTGVVVGETAVIGNRVSLMHVSHPDPKLILLFDARINLGTYYVGSWLTWVQCVVKLCY